MANLSDHLVNYQSNDTLDSVTSRGATTTNNLTIGNLISDKVQVGGSTVNAYRIYANSDETNPLIGVFNHSNLDTGFITISANGTTDFTQVRLGANVDDMVLFSGGAERARLDENGRLQISNNTNENVLHVRRASAVNPASGAGITLGTDYSNTGIVMYGTGDGQFVVSQTSDITATQPSASGYLERMRIDASGNVGIGNTTPSAKLYVQTGTTGTIATFRGADTDLLNIDGDSNAITLDARNVGTFNIERQGSTALTIDNSTNVGIGNTNPVTKLYVHGTGDQLSSEVRVENTSTTQNGRGVVRVKSNTSTYGGGIFATNNDETAYGNNVLGLYTFDNQDLVIGTNNIRRMIIKAGGYAGLGGITDPQHFLDINCGAGAAPTYKGHIRLNSSSAVNSGHGGLEFMGSFFGSGYGVRLATVDEGSGNTPLTFNVRAAVTAWTEVMRITTTNSGRVGIKCTAPPNAFHVGSTMSIGDGNNQSITMRSYGSSDTDITSLIGGSSFGGLVLGTAYGHYVIGLQDNDDNDSFAVISGGGTTVGGAGTSFMDDQTFDYTCMRVLSKGIYNTPLGTSGRDVNINSVGILGYYSSVREHKGNINSMTDISWLYNLNPVTFNYKQQNSNFEFIEELETETSYGLIADEVANVNSDFVFYNTNDELAGVDYKMFTAVLIKALQDHKSTIESLETRIAALEAN